MSEKLTPMNIKVEDQGRLACRYNGYVYAK